MRVAGITAAFVVATVLAIVYFGWASSGDSSPSSGATSTPPVIGAEIPYYENISVWPRYEDIVARFSIAHPIDFVTDSTRDGEIFFTLAIPATFLPQTNFSEAILTVARRIGSQAVARCLDALSNESIAGVQRIDNLPFTIFTSSETAAENRYLTASYRGRIGNVCYVIEYVIHSTALEEYPPEYRLKAFDEQKVKEALDRITGTFRLL